QGLQIALLSNDSVELRPKLEKLALIDLFNPLIISAEIGVMKPARAAYRAVLDKLSCAPDEALFIDDREENIEGAQDVGLRTLHAVAGLNLVDSLNQMIDA